MTTETELPPPSAEYMGEYVDAEKGILPMYKGAIYTAEEMAQAVAAERERILSELDGFRCNEKAVNMSGHDVIRDELLDDLAAAIREPVK